MDSIGLRRPLQEISNQAQTSRLALLGVKLRTYPGVSADNRCHIAPVINMGQPLCRCIDGDVIGMDEICVISGLDPIQNWVVTGHNQIIPPHMGDL